MPVFGRSAYVKIDTLKVEGLDIRFDVTLQANNLGKAVIEIFNLSEAHRKQLEKAKDLDVELCVAYDTQTPLTLFKGVVRQAKNKKQGVDWISILESGDGDKAQKAHVSTSHPPKTDLEVVWKDIVKQIEGFGVKAGNAAAAFKKAISEGKLKDGVSQLVEGLAIHGPALQELKKIARRGQLDVEIQNGELVVIPFNTAAETLAIVLSPTTGLIGSPEKMVDKDGKSYVQVRSLILPGLLPRRKVKVDSALVKGTYMVRLAQYTGDLSGQDWYADLECVLI